MHIFDEVEKEIFMNTIEKLYEKLKDNPYFQYFSVKTQYEKRNVPRAELMEYFAQENKRMAPYMCPYENPFMNIMNYEDKMFFMFSKDDEIVVQEKIDGSNAHLNVSEDEFQCYGNRYILNEHNNLQGYWFWCRDHFQQVTDRYFGLDIYGEWLVPHHCSYPAERYGEFYVFDVMENGNYWTQDKVEKLAVDCGFQYAPVFYRGTFESWKHLMSFVGMTGLGGEKGEGIVVKNQTTINSAKKQFYIKIVDEEFQETNKSRKEIKTVDMDKVLELERQIYLAESIVTVPRVRKILLKLVDSKELPSSWDVLTDTEIKKIVKPYVYKDCMKEEQDIVAEIGRRFGKYCDELTLQAIRKLKEEA